MLFVNNIILLFENFDKRETLPCHMMSSKTAVPQRANEIIFKYSKTKFQTKRDFQLIRLFSGRDKTKTEFSVFFSCKA